MAFLAPLAGILSIASTAKGLFGSKEKPPAPAPLPAAPTQQGATTDAKLELEKRRRISLLSGGATDVTRGTAGAGAGNVQQKKLVGE